MFFHCSCALADEVNRLKSEVVTEQNKVKFYQALLQRTQEELESIRVRYYECFIVSTVT